LEDDREEELHSSTFKPSRPKKRIAASKKSVFDNPLLKIVFFSGTTYILHLAASSAITIQGDYAMLLFFTFFCVGKFVFHPQFEDSTTVTTPPPAIINKLSKMKSSQKRGVSFHRNIVQNKSVALIRKSMSIANGTALIDFDEDEDEDEGTLESPLRYFPANGDPLVDLNCYSEPDAEAFHVRGANYLVDKKKVTSGPFIFPIRGVDLFLTDDCPEDIGRNSGILGGALRKKPTFIINFRLPWGNFICYFEIPSKFLPFLSKRYDPSFSGELPSMDSMSGAERATCKYLMGDDEHKKQTFKFIPKVIIGPWIVKSIVGSTPAIMGNKLPINYVYKPGEPSVGKAPYLEADLDIVASAAARKILAVCRSQTQSLTLDLGFTIQGTAEDELPEQMLFGARIHGLDPLHAPLLPHMPEIKN